MFLAACEFGYYGIGCRQKCSAFCETSFDCNTVTGQCNGGCLDGWEGPKCLKRMSIITFICCIIKTIILVKRTEYNLKNILCFFCMYTIHNCQPFVKSFTFSLKNCLLLPCLYSITFQLLFSVSMFTIDAHKWKMEFYGMFCIVALFLMIFGIMVSYCVLTR